MNVAVFHNLPSGGAKRTLFGFVKYLRTAGCAVDALVPATADEGFLSLKGVARKVQAVPVRATAVGVMRSALRYLPPVKPLTVSLADLETTQRRIADMINRGDYHVVLVEQDRYTMSPFILKFLHKPHIYYCQQPFRLQERVMEVLLDQMENGASPLRPLHKLLRRWAAARLAHIDRENAAAAAGILANSYFSREAILRAYGRNAAVCYLGVDVETFIPLNEPRADYVLSVGYMQPHKGYDFLVNALARISENQRPRLVIVANGGDPGWRQHIEALAVRRGVTLEVRSMITDHELVQLYNRAKLFLYAPYLEPFGLAPLEAMACGTPVAAVQEGGARESVIPDHTGVLTERDEDAFAAAVADLLAADEKRRRIGRHAAEVVRNFWTSNHAGARLLRHLQRVTNAAQ